MLGFGESLSRQRQQLHRQFLQGFVFVLIDVASFVFLETKNEDPSAAFIGSDQGPKTSAFALTRPGNAFLQQPAAKIGLIQTSRHFSHSSAKTARRQTLFACPSIKPLRCVEGHACAPSGDFIALSAITTTAYIIEPFAHDLLHRQHPHAE
jgi:hypothetical protein